MAILPEIDFPPVDQTPFTDDNGYTWDYNGVTWVRRTQGNVDQAPDDGMQYARVTDPGMASGYWEIVEHPNAEVPEAPLTAGKIYARGEGQWNEITYDPVGGIPDGPANGSIYGRKDNAWALISVADIPDFQTELDKKADIDHVHTTDDFIDGAGDPIAVVEEVPSGTGKSYVREEGDWVEFDPAAGLYLHQAITLIRPDAEDDATLLFSPGSINLSSVHAHITGAGSSVTMNIRYAPTRNAASPTDIYTVNQVIDSEAGVELPVPNITSIPVNSWVWVEVISVAGDPVMAHVTMEYQLG